MHEQLQSLQRIWGESEHLYSSPFCQMKQIVVVFLHARCGYSIELGWSGNEKRVCVVSRGVCVSVCACVLGGVFNIKVQNINSPRGKLVVSKTILH